MMKTMHIPIFIAIVFLVTTCEHRELCFAHARITEVQVISNWKYAPEAHPASMRLYLFPETGEEPLIYEFGNHMEGKITVSAGCYYTLYMNNDTEFILPRDTDYYESIRTYLADGVFPHPVPRAGNTDEQQIRLTSDKLWSNRMGEVEVVVSAEEQTLALYPKAIICHCAVEIRNVESLKYLTEGELFGSLTSILGGFMLGTNLPTKELATLPLDMISDSKPIVNADFYAFDYPVTSINTQYLIVYTILSDGRKYSSTYDIAEKIYNSPDPTNIHILFDRLPLPKPMDNDGRLNLDVDEWSTIEIDISM